LFKTYYVIRDSNEELGYAELKALPTIYRAGSIECYTSICIGDHDPEIVWKIIKRAGYVKEGGLLIGVDDLIKPSYSYIDAVKDRGLEWIRVSNVRSLSRVEHVSRYVNRLVEKTGLSIQYRKGKYLHIIVSEDKVFAGIPITTQDKGGLYSRKPSKRPFFRSIGLDPWVSRFMINLSRVREGEVLLDPFVGTGSILLEACSIGVRSVGVEIDRVIVRGCLENVMYYGCGYSTLVIYGDSLDILLNSVDGVATDPPYGRAASTHGVDVYRVYDGFLNNICDMVKPGGYIVFMAPTSLENYIDGELCNHGLLVVGKHYVYIHGGLTRIIYEVLRS